MQELPCVICGENLEKFEPIKSAAQGIAKTNTQQSPGQIFPAEQHKNSGLLDAKGSGAISAQQLSCGSPSVSEDSAYMHIILQEINNKHSGILSELNFDLCGETTCPKCKGGLIYTISAYNHHIRVTCKTQDCIGFTQ